MRLVNPEVTLHVCLEVTRRAKKQYQQLRVFAVLFIRELVYATLWIKEGTSD